MSPVRRSRTEIGCERRERLIPDSKVQSERFEAVYRAHFESVSRYCLRRLPVEDARDATTEVFETVWRKLDTITDHDHVLPWLHRVAHHVVLNRSRSTRRYLRLVDRIAGEPGRLERDPADMVLVSEPHRRVQMAMASLGATDREILRLRAYEELSVRQLSLVLECSVDAAKKRSSRALQRLRAALESQAVSSAPRALGKEGRTS